MARRCSHCCNNGHNSRTCPSRCGGAVGGVDGGGGVKLFGVRLTESPLMKKSASMGNLLHYHSSSSAAASPNSASPTSEFLHGSVNLVDGYLSDDPAHANRRAERKKGIPWTEEEHRLFLVGLQKLGKGDWRGISRNFVMSRTPTQVASHAQKYFIRMSNASRRKRRSSLFDIVPELVPEPPPLEGEQDPTPDCEAAEGGDANSFPSLSLSLNAEPMDAISQGVNVEDEERNEQTDQLPTMVPAFLPAYIPITIPIWFSNSVAYEVNCGALAAHEVLKPTPVVCGEPVNLDEVVKMSGLSLEELTSGRLDPLQPTLKLLGLSPGTSAFHVSTVSTAQS